MSGYVRLTVALVVVLAVSSAVYVFLDQRMEDRDRDVAVKSAHEAAFEATGDVDTRAPSPGPGRSVREGPAQRRETMPISDPYNIEEIKRHVYSLEIESVQDLPLLDSVVMTGDGPVREYWRGDWVSIDDWKQDINGFYLAPQDDGTFVFFPDEETTRTYTFFETPKVYRYDPVRREFFWEASYYGKPISHRARFITPDVLAMMLISGDKVSLDLYCRNPQQGRD